MQRRALKRIMELTLVLHACMAAFVLVDALRTGRDKRWVAGTLAGGLLVAFPYLATDALRSRLPTDRADADAEDLAFDAAGAPESHDGYENVGGVDVDVDSD